MADSKISGLSATTTVADDDMYVVATAAGATKKITGANLKTGITTYRSGGTDVAVADGGTGSSTAGAAREALSVLPRLAYLSANYYEPMRRPTTIAASAMTQSRVYYQPFLPHTTATFDRLAVSHAANCTATAVGRLGIYNSDANYKPSTVLLDAGTFAADSGAGVVRPITISQQLTGGVLYWLCFVQQTAGGGTFYSSAAGPTGFGSLIGTSDFGSNQSGWYQEGVTGSLATVGTLVADGAVIVPLIAIRAA